jgi:hypothetical protein
LATKAEVDSISTQGRHIVIKPHETVIAGVAKQSLDRKYEGAIKIGPTRIKLDSRLLGDRWKAVLEEILSSSCV